jgi:hypothetical protein
MAGEIWLRQVRAAEEVTEGVRVTPATRKLYMSDVSFNDEGANQVVSFDTGTPDNVRGVASASRVPTGTGTLPVSADELVEYLLMAFSGTVTPSTPAGGTLARDWVFTPAATTDSARAWSATGTRVNTIGFAGEVGGDNTVSLGFFCNDLSVQALTGSPTDRVPTFMRGWELRAYLGAAGTDPTTLTSIPQFVKSYAVNINRNLGRKYLGNNTQAMTRSVMGLFGADGNLMVEATAAQALTEFNNYRSATPVMLRLEMGNNSQIEASPTTEVQTLTEGTPMTAGTYTLTFRGFTTSALAYNATAAQTQTALENLASIGQGNVVVTGGPLDTAIVTITFAGQLAGENVPQLTSNQTSLTGTFTHATSTPGVGYKRLIWIDVPIIWTTFDLGGEDAGTRMYTANWNYIYNATLGYSAKITLRNARATAWA